MTESTELTRVLEEKIRREQLEQFSSELKERVTWNQRVEMPMCSCFGDSYKYEESKEGPYYTHLGSGPSVAALRHIMELRTGLTGDALRFEKLCYTGKEGKSTEGCPVAKWVIRRANFEEKMLILVRQRPGHFCSSAWIIIGIAFWEGLESSIADELYDYLTSVLPQKGEVTERRYGINEKRTCACQGFDSETCGSSYNFGCSWSMYNNACKFARTKGLPRKFRLKDSNYEAELEDHMQKLATIIAPLYQRIAPDAFYKQTEFEGVASSCRLGYQPGRPFSGVNGYFDYCIHSNKDVHNMNNGCTVMVSLTRHRGLSRSDDEQLHVLPLYILDSTDENGCTANQWRKVEQGQIEVLTSYPRLMRVRSEMLASSSARKRAKRQAKAESLLSKEGKEELALKSTPSKKSKSKAKPKPIVETVPLTVQPSQQQTTISFAINPSPIEIKIDNPAVPSDSTEEILPAISDWFRKPIENYFNFEIIKEDFNPGFLFGFPSNLVEFQTTHQQPHPFVNEYIPYNPNGSNPCSVTGEKQEYWTQNEEIFLDPEVGGVGISLPHGSVYFQVSRREFSGTTSLLRPNRCNPSRISLVFYQHKNLHYWHHGYLEWERKRRDVEESKLKKEKDEMDEFFNC